MGTYEKRAWEVPPERLSLCTVSKPLCPSRCLRMCLAPPCMSQTLPTQPVWALHTAPSTVGQWMEAGCPWERLGCCSDPGRWQGEIGMFPIFRDIGVLWALASFFFLPVCNNQPKPIA